MTVPAGYIRVGYTWRNGSQFGSKADADAVAAELECIERETGGNGVALEAMLVRARMSDSALHNLMEHNQAEAARQHNLDEMAAVLRALHHRYVNQRTEDEVAGPRAYQPVRAVTDDKSRPGVYLKVTTAQAPEPPRHTAPTSYTVTTTASEPRTVAPHWVAPPPRAVEPPSIQPPAEPRVPNLPEEKMIRLTESRERARNALMRWADTLERDPYFAGVVAAIRALG